MPCISANSANDVSGEVTLLRAVVFAVTDLTTCRDVSNAIEGTGKDKEILTVLACLVFVVAECTIESCKFAKLVALELILSFWDRGSLGTEDISLHRSRYG